VTVLVRPLQAEDGPALRVLFEATVSLCLRRSKLR